VKIQIMGRKFCLSCKGKTLPRDGNRKFAVINQQYFAVLLSRRKFEFSLKVKVIKYRLSF
jgi:hypothetical protein